VAAGADPSEVDARVIAAAKEAGVHDLILSLEGGYDAKIGPRGRGLSAGQQQRVALARALYGDPVLYVFDEPNANLDAEGEAILVNVIARLKARGALVVLSAHRFGLIVATDMLAVLRSGRVERFGPRQEVLDWLKTAEPARPAPVRPAGEALAAPR
jgi:ABC-type protease/lipase transport system fused ATPase/permease subunit